MPEGDTIHSTARRIRRALVGARIEAIETPQARHARDRWPERLGGRAVRAVDAKGKHLFIRFDGDLTLHSHLRMTGKWGVYPRGERWRRAPRRAWLVLRTPEHEVVQFDGPVLELMTDSRTRFDQRIAGLGPDVLADGGFDESLFLRRLRGDDATRGIGDALLDQRNLSGIGNVWKSEGCFLARVDPWRRLRDVSDHEALAIVRGIRPLMQLSAERGGRIVSYEPEKPLRRGEKRMWAFERTGLPCRRCGTPIRSRGQGDDNRTTYWCPRCQA
jgi:endonuclease VIII